MLVELLLGDSAPVARTSGQQCHFYANRTLAMRDAHWLAMAHAVYSIEAFRCSTSNAIVGWIKSGETRL